MFALSNRLNNAYPAWNRYLLAGYDPAGQLTSAWAYQPDGTPVSNQKWSYGYDAAQNLVKRTNNLTVETFSVNALNQVVGLPGGAAGYDRRGNLVTRTFGGSQAYWTWTYDPENQLTSVATDTYYTPEASRWKVEFVYDGQGRVRIRHNYTWYNGNWYGSGGETRYLYDGLLLVQERSAGNLPLVTYTRGRDLSGTLAGAGGIGGLLARSHGYSGGNWTSHTFYHADGNGNVTALVNSAGTLQAGYRYDPYGRWLSGGGSLASANGLRFSSKPWVGFAGSPTSGLYYYGYRFYDPYLQRWVNRDPIGEWGGFNLYNYTENRPGSVFDPMGLHNPIRTGRFWACMVDLGINTGISSIPIIGIIAPEVDFVQATIYGETDYELDPISTTLNLGEQSTCGKLNKRGKIVKPKRLMRWNRFFGVLGKLWEAKDILQNIRECWHKGKQPI